MMSEAKQHTLKTTREQAKTIVWLVMWGILSRGESASGKAGNLLVSITRPYFMFLNLDSSKPML
jgi:hypothetical protein